MRLPILDRTITVVLRDCIEKLEDYFGTDVIFYYGQIHPTYGKQFRDFIEQIKGDDKSKPNLTIILNSPGGVAEMVEKMVDMTRFHYREVYFAVPDYAMSAGTIWCLSGDKIYMDYSSSLGPIDPQIEVDDQLVPALGYLEQVKKMLRKSEEGTLTGAEFAILRELDLAFLNSLEQAKELTVTLLREWLVKYKFKSWKTHSKNKKKLGQKVTMQEKKGRAESIARKLGDHSHWHSHGRMIGIDVLTKDLKLKIEDYSKDDDLRPLIRKYNDIITDYIARMNIRFFLHSRLTFKQF